MARVLRLSTRGLAFHRFMGLLRKGVQTESAAAAAAVAVTATTATPSSKARKAAKEADDTKPLKYVRGLVQRTVRLLRRRVWERVSALLSVWTIALALVHQMPLVPSPVLPSCGVTASHRCC